MTFLAFSLESGVIFAIKSTQNEHHLRKPNFLVSPLLHLFIPAQLVHESFTFDSISREAGQKTALQQKHLPEDIQ